MARPITPEVEYIEKWGTLPGKEEREWIKSELILQCNIDLDEEWVFYWRNSDSSRELLERCYEFWGIQRKRIERSFELWDELRSSGVERAQARADSGD